MKRFILGILVGGLIVGLVGAAGFLAVRAVAAQTPQPPDGVPYGPGMMGRGYGRGMMGGMMGTLGIGQPGTMHEYMEAAFADALGITEEDLQAQLAEGKTMLQVATDQGLSQDEAWTLMQTTRNSALDKMVADGVITSDRAEWMKQHMQSGTGFGAGCPGMGGRGWNNSQQNQG